MSIFRGSRFSKSSQNFLKADLQSIFYYIFVHFLTNHHETLRLVLHNIHLDFRIVGETKEAVEKARNMLEYGDMTINVDFDIACKLIRIKDTFF